MPINNDGVMIILSSPSGVGKTTITKKIQQVLDNINEYKLNKI